MAKAKPASAKTFKAPPTAKQLARFELHPKVAVPVLAGALVNVLIETAKARFGVDLTDMQPDLIVIAVFLAGHFVPSK